MLSNNDTYLGEGLTMERVLTPGALLLFVAVTMIVLGFVPLVPPDDAIKGGGLTERGVIEFGLILAGIFLMSLYAKAKGIEPFEFRNPSFAIISMFAVWAIVSSLWSPNAILTIAKAAELWIIMIGASMFVAHSLANQNRVEVTLGGALIAVLCISILANVVFWGTPLPTTGDESLPLHLLGEEPPVLMERPRLILAYAHPLLTGDLLALSAIAWFAARSSKLLKATLIPILLGLLWMADARGPSIAVVAALIAMAILKVKRNNVRVIVIALVISLALAVAMVFQQSLLKPISSLLTDDVYTLNSRTELWSKAFEYIGQRPIAGYGYYASRYLLMKDFIWGGHAHNSLVEILLTTGLIGLILLVTYLAYLCRDVVRSQNGLLLGVAIYTIIQGMLNPLLFSAGLPMFVLTIAALNASCNRNVALVEDDWSFEAEAAA